MQFMSEEHKLGWAVVSLQNVFCSGQKALSRDAYSPSLKSNSVVKEIHIFAFYLIQKGCFSL